MNRRIAVIALAAATLSACQSTTVTMQQVALSPEDIDRLRVDRDERRISYYVWAERTGAAARAGGPLSPPEEAALLHRQELAWRVDAGLVTPEQFEAEIAVTAERVRAAKAGYEVRRQPPPQL